MFTPVSKAVIREVTSCSVAKVSSHDRDEMAIPSYLHYNPFIRWLMWKRYKSIYQMACFHKEMAVLEFGCGAGLFLPSLMSSCGKVYAVDLFPGFAKKLCRRYQLPVCFPDNIEEIADTSLDVIVAADVLEHLEDVSGFLELFKAKLRDTGKLIVSGPTENLLYKAGRVLAGFSGKGDYHHTNIDHLLNEIESCGFILEQTQKLPVNINPCLFKIAQFVLAQPV